MSDDAPEKSPTSRPKGEDRATPTTLPVAPQIVASPIIKMTEQVGQNVLTALDQPGTVAVLSTLVPGIRADRIVSVPLSPAQLHEVHALLNDLVPAEPVDDEDMPCIGFHCEMQPTEVD